jgi:hypothetical protein
VSLAQPIFDWRLHRRDFEHGFRVVAGGKIDRFLPGAPAVAHSPDPVSAADDSASANRY